MRVQITPRDAEAASQTPPQPNDPSVSIEIAGGEIIASLRFEGNATPELAAALRQRLLAALEAGGYGVWQEAGCVRYGWSMVRVERGRTCRQLAYILKMCQTKPRG